jgi:hypothetical protein
MDATYVTATIAALAANAFSGITALVPFTAEMTAVAQAGVPQSWSTVPLDTLTSALAPGLLFGLFGVPLFGIFGTVVLVMFFASAFGGRSREHGNPSGLGLVIGFMVVFIIMLAINVALR